MGQLVISHNRGRIRWHLSYESGSSTAKMPVRWSRGISLSGELHAVRLHGDITIHDQHRCRYVLSMYKVPYTSAFKCSNGRKSVCHSDSVVSIMDSVLLHNVTSTFHSRREVPWIRDYVIAINNYAQLS